MYAIRSYYGIDFFPLVVDFVEKFSAAGKNQRQLVETRAADVVLDQSIP